MQALDMEIGRRHAVAGAEAGVRRLKWLAAATRFEIALRRHALALKAGFNPAQPRVPKGNPGPGRWIKVAGGGSGSRGRYGANFPGATYGQLIRLDLNIARTENAIQQIRKYDPNWRPAAQSWRDPNSIEGAIRHAEVRAEQAEARLHELRTGLGGNSGPPLDPVSPPRSASFERDPFDGGPWIKMYRAANNMSDLFGRPAWPTDSGTVAVTKVDGKLYFGTNSTAPVYASSDQKEADASRRTLVNKYPRELPTENIGSKPNDAFYHAEATVLLRVAKDNGGTLAGRLIEVQTDREMCPTSCLKVLPKLGLELGNPRVIFVGPNGKPRTMHNGRWE